ncbi:MAG TPA: prepilin-type N-terminal cleavage/methylation domain-containing protein [Terriglobales bacterium]|nr:prepilin-type N-terminal cleavage/methylation domain-containing protein [Terriglobales bacterium]
MTRQRPRSAGFTLMEVVIAISMTSAIILILFMGLRLGANAWRRGEQRLADRARVVAGVELLARQVAAASPRVLQIKRDEKPISIVDFSGSSTELRFVSGESWQADRSRPAFLARYRVAEAPEGKRQLFVSESALTDNDSIVRELYRDYGLRFGGWVEPASEPVGDPADRIRLAYLLTATPQQPAQWIAEWDPEQHDRLPCGVRIEWTRGSQIETVTLPVTLTRDPAQAGRQQ